MTGGVTGSLCEHPTCNGGCRVLGSRIIELREAVCAIPNAGRSRCDVACRELRSGLAVASLGFLDACRFGIARSCVGLCVADILAIASQRLARGLVGGVPVTLRPERAVPWR